MTRKLFLMLLLVLTATTVAMAKKDRPRKAKASQQQEVVESSAQPTQSIDTQPAKDKPLMKVEIMPTFMGGDLMIFRNWVQSRLQYPAVAQRNGIQGTVMVCFVVEIDGSLSEIKILQSPDPSLSQEVMRVVKSAPNKWKPGRQNGNVVRVRMVVPFSFRRR